jgi:hypothetical protein
MLAGRRIIYDYDTLGDCPTCLSKEGTNIDGKTAQIEGFKITEKGIFAF